MTERPNGMADYDEPNPFDLLYPERDAPMKQQPWSQADVFCYREALTNLGITGDKLEDIIERDCGREFCERPFLSLRQAG